MGGCETLEEFIANYRDTRLYGRLAMGLRFSLDSYTLYNSLSFLFFQVEFCLACNTPSGVGSRIWDWARNAYSAAQRPALNP